MRPRRPRPADRGRPGSWGASPSPETDRERQDESRSAENSFDNISSRISGFYSHGEHLAAGGFHFFPARNKVRPVRALDEHLRQNQPNQLPPRVLGEQRDR